LKPNLKFQPFFISGSIIIPNTNTNNFCDNVDITSQGFIGDIKSNIINQDFCISSWNCSNCNVNGLSQEICYNFIDSKQTIFTNFFLYELKFSSVINNNYYVLNGTILLNEVLNGNSPSYIYVFLFKSIYKTLFGNNIGPLLHFLDYIGPIIPDYFSYGLFGFISGILS
jgi:hypothetical protein